jgi:hypothetical protein
MVTTCAGHAKKLSGAELDDDDGDNHGMYLEDLFDDETQCANPSGALAKACIESILNPPPPFESDDDEVDHDQTNVTEYTPPNTDLTLPVPTAVKAIMAEDIRRQQNLCAHTFLAELDEELMNKNKS